MLQPLQSRCTQIVAPQKKLRNILLIILDPDKLVKYYRNIFICTEMFFMLYLYRETSGIHKGVINCLNVFTALFQVQKQKECDFTLILNC